MSIASLFRRASQQQGDASMPHHYRERALSQEWLFHGKDEVGREGWFVRIEVTGMYPRRVGPFARKRRPVKCWRTSCTIWWSHSALLNVS